MKKIFIFLLTFVLIYNPCFCYASEYFDYGVNKTTAVDFNDTIIMFDNITETKVTTSLTFDFVPLFNRTIVVPVKKNVSALIRNFCKMCSSTYDSASIFLETYCGDNSNYTFTVSGNNYSLSTLPANGTVGIMDIPEGEFSAYIENNDDIDLTCNTNLLGYGLDTTPEEGYNINLTCYDKLPDGEKTNMWAWLGPVIGIGTALVGFGGYAGIQKARGENIIPEA